MRGRAGFKKGLRVTSTADLQLWLLVWLVTAAYILVRHWRSQLGTGLVFTYVLSYGAIHWLAAAIYLLPWYTAPWSTSRSRACA